MGAILGGAVIGALLALGIERTISGLLKRHWDDEDAKWRAALREIDREQQRLFDMIFETHCEAYNASCEAADPYAWQSVAELMGER